MTQLMCNFYISLMLLIFFFFFFVLAVIIKEGYSYIYRLEMFVGRSVNMAIELADDDVG